MAWVLPLRESDRKLHRFVPMPSTLIEHRLTLLIAEVQDLRSELRQAVGHFPRPGQRWVTTTQLSQELGVTGRTVLSWLVTGRFPADTYKKRPRGSRFQYLLDRSPALAAAERIVCGEL
jgi:hypothetical protein